MKYNESQRRLTVKRMGVPITVDNWSWDGTTDDYGDPAPGSFTKTQTDSYVILQESQRAEQLDDVDGPNTEETVRAFLPDDIEIHVASDADATKATEFEVKEDGTRYKVYDTKPGYRGITKVLCRRPE